MITRPRASATALALLGFALTACGSSSTTADPTPTAAGSTGAAADTTQCSDAVTPLPSPLGSGFPEAFPFPPSTTVYDVEDRGDSGVIATGISTAPFADVLAFLNGPAVDAGFAIDKGETEDRDAEAEFEGNGYRGRWAIRVSATCPGETVIQVVARQEAN